MEEGKTKAIVHYRGTLEDGSEFDSTYAREKPMSFIVGAHMMLPAFEAAVVSMQIGEKRYLRLKPEDAYGEYKDEYVMEARKENLPNSQFIQEGQAITIRSSDDSPGQTYRVLEIKEDTIVLDANHELAGKTLTFDIELVDMVAIAPPGQAL